MSVLSGNALILKVGDIVLYKEQYYAYVGNIHTDSFGMRWYEIVFQVALVTTLTSVNRTTLPHDMAERYLKIVD